MSLESRIGLLVHGLEGRDVERIDAVDHRLDGALQEGDGGPQLMRRVGDDALLGLLEPPESSVIVLNETESSGSRPCSVSRRGRQVARGHPSGRRVERRRGDRSRGREEEAHEEGDEARAERGPQDRSETESRKTSSSR